MSSSVEQESSEKALESNGVESNGLEIEEVTEEAKAVQVGHDVQDSAERNSLLSEYDDLRREMTALRNEHEKAVTDKQDVFLQLQKVQLQVNEWETNYNTLKEDNQRLKRENTEMKRQVTVGGKAEYDVDRERLTNEIASLNAKITSIKESYEYVQLEKSTVEEKVTILQKTISSLENANESLLMEKDRLQQGLDSSLTREREGSVRGVHEQSTVHHSYSSSGDYDSLKLKYDEVCREKYSLEYQLRVAKEKISEMESRPRLESSSEHGHHSIVPHSVVPHNYIRLEGDYKQLLHDKIKMASEMEVKHRRELEEKQTFIYKLEQEIHEIRTNKARYDELYKENEFLVKEKFSLENELRTVKDKLIVAESSRVHETRLEKELVAYNDKYGALEREYSTLMQDKRKLEADLYIQGRKENEEKQAQIFMQEREIVELQAEKTRYNDVCREKEYLMRERASMENELRIAREKTIEFESRSMMESRIEQELSIYKDRYSQLEKEYSEAMQDRRRHEADLHIHVRREVDEKQAYIYKLESEMHELRMNAARYEDVLKEKEFLVKERFNLENELRTSRQKIVEFDSRSVMEGRLESELVAYKEKYAKLEVDYSSSIQEKRRLEANFHIQMRKELDEKQSQIYQLEAEMQELRMDKAMYDDLYKEKEYIVKDKFDLECELRNTRGKLMEFESRSILEGRTEKELVIYQEKLTQLEKEYSNMMHERRRFEADLHIQVRKEVDEKQDHIYKIERELHELQIENARYDDLYKEKEFILKDRLNLERELQLARQKIVEMENQSMMDAKMEKELVLVQERYTKLEKDYSLLVQEKRRVETEVNIQARKEIEEKQSHMYKLELELRELRMDKGRFDELTKEKEFLVKEKFDMETELRATREKIMKYETRSLLEGRVEKELTTFKEKYTQLERDYSVLMQEKRRVETEVNIQARKEVEEKQSHIYKLDLELRELRMDKGRFDELTKEKEFLVKEKFDLETELRVTREKIMEYETRSILEGRVEKELTIFKEKYSQLEKDYSVLMQEKRRVETEFSIQARHEVEEKQSHIYKLDLELRELRMDKGRFDELTKEKELLVKEKFSMETELRVTREKIMEYETRSILEGRIEKELTIFKEKYTQLEKDYSVLMQEKRRVETEFSIQARHEVEEKQSHIYKLEIELRELRMDKGRFDELTKEKEFLVKEKFDLETELRVTREKIMKYETRSMLEGRVEKELTTFKEKYTQLERDYSVLMQEKRRVETEVNIQARKEVEEKQSHIYKLDLELRELRMDKGRFDELTKEKGFLVKEKFDLETELRVTREKIVEYETRSILEGRVEKELTMFKEKYTQLEKDYSVLMQEKRRMETEGHSLARKEVEEKQSHICRLEQEMREMSMEKGRYDDLYKEKEFLLKERYNLTNELRITREKVVEIESRSMMEARTEKELLLLHEKYGTLEKDYSLLMQEKRKLETDVEIRVRKEGEERQGLIYKLENEILVLRDEKETYDHVIQEKEFLIKERYNRETELRETREKMLEFEARIKTDGVRAEQEMAIFSNKYAKLEEDYNFLVEENKRLEEDIEIRVKKEFWEKQESVYKLEKEIRELKSENEYYQTTLDEKNASISELRVSVNNLQRQVETRKKELFVAEEAYEKAELKLKEVLKSEYKPVTTYAIRRSIRTSSSSGQPNASAELTKTVFDEGPVTSTPNVERKPEVKVVESSGVSVEAKTIDFNEKVAGVTEVPADKSEVTKEESAFDERLSDSVFISSYHRPASVTSPLSSSIGSGNRFSNKYSSSGYDGSSYSGGSSYRVRQPSTTRYSSTRKYY